MKAIIRRDHVRNDAPSGGDGMSKAELVIEEGFAVARCYEEKCDFDHASREKVRKHVVEFTRSTRAVYKRTG